VVDSRAARVLADGRRDMVDDDEWAWIVDHARGSYDHLVIASTLPVFMLPGAHHVEAWNEAVCSGAWGGLAARAGEQLRRALDLEHWPAFQRSFVTMVALLGELGRGGAGEPPPSTITLLGGDVHTAYLADVQLPGSVGSRVYQAVCSPFRNPLSATERRIIKTTNTRLVCAIARNLARLAGVRPTGARWRTVAGPTFDNSIAMLQLDERAATLTICRSCPEDEDGPVLQVLHRRELA
jgi:hypothetical protein